MTTRLPRSSPEAEGVASNALATFFAALDGVRSPHAAKVLRHGSVIAEATWRPYDASRPHSLFSISKSFTSMAIGLLIDEGRLSLDDHVVELLPHDTPPEPSANLAALQLRHLLEMTAGHDREPFPGDNEDVALTWAQYVLATPIPHPPGTHWMYNTPATYLLSCIVQSVTGGRMLDYLTPRLFEPLGIENPVWEQSPQGVDTGGWGLSITIEDLAVFGQFLLQRGQWNGRQVVPAAWIDAATARQADNGNRPGEPVDWQQGYGYQFWRCRNGAYRGDGAFGQFVVVMPDEDAVFVMTGGYDDMQGVLDHLWTLVGTFDSDGPPAEVGSDVVSDRALELPAGEVRDEELEHSYDGPVQRVRVHGATLEIDGSEFALHPDGWATGEFQGEPVALAGGWQGDTFAVLARLVETPFSNTLRIDPDGRLTISIDRGFSGPGVVWSGLPRGAA